VNAAILSIGDELILGQIAERNAGWLSGRLADEGVAVVEHRTVPDDLDAIVEALASLASRCDIVISTGGLGPTDDDLLRAALARVLGGAELVEDPEARTTIERWFAGRRTRMPEINLRQALRPPGAKCLPNDHGTAPGLAATLRRTRIWSLPGPPSEMHPMFERDVAPALFEDRARPKILRQAVPVFGLGESTVAERLGELMQRGRNPLVGTTASGAIVTIRVRAHGAAAEDRAGFDRFVEEIAARMHPHALGIGGVTLPMAVGEASRERGAMVALAESCTGGMAASMLCDVPGASAWFRGGVVSYTNELKESLLGVPHDVLERFGAVSAETARAMAEGALHRLGASAAASITGIAGPDGGTPEKPVGTVWIATSVAEARSAAAPREPAGASSSSATDAPGVRTHVRAFRFRGDRAAVRDRAARAALGALRLHLLGLEETPLLGERTGG